MVFIKEIIRLHGVPSNIVSDCGVQFTSKFWKELCLALDIKNHYSLAYHPQTNGQTERTNQTLEQYLRCFSTFVQDNWASLLPCAEFAFNNAMHSTTKQSRFMPTWGTTLLFPQVLPASALVPAVWKRVEFLHNLELLKDTMAKAQLDY